MTPRIKVDFYEEGHLYQLNGNDTVSVTTMMSHEGLTDYQWCDESDRQRGSAVHKIAQIVSRNWRGSTVEEIIRNSRWDPERTSPKLVGYGYAAAKFLLEKQFRPVLVEQPIGSVDLGICGTLDAWGQLPDGTSLLPDYKSGRPLPAVWIQMALYAKLLKDTYGLDTDLIAPVWLQADGEYKIWPPQKPGGADLTIGISAINVFKWRLKHKLLG